MCIIAAIEKGGRLPDADTIRVMWTNNPDGAGLMWADGDKVYGVKGLMTLEAFGAALRAVPAGAAAVLHFRIATSGGVRPEMCHPWPITSDPAALVATTWAGPYGLAHNGVLHGLGCKDLSDTGEFVRDVAAPLLDMCRDLLDKRAVSIMRAASAGSRLALLDGSGRLVLTGDGWEEGPDGVMYSNPGYLPRKWIMYNWDGWDAYQIDSDADDDIMPLYDTGAYIIDDVGQLEEPDDYGIDPDGKIYLYDPDETDGGPWWIPCDGYRAFNTAGLPLKWEEVCGCV